MEEDEPLRPPEDRPLSQPRSNSGLSRLDRSAPLPDQVGHHRPNTSSHPRRRPEASLACRDLCTASTPTRTNPSTGPMTTLPESYRSDHASPDSADRKRSKPTPDKAATRSIGIIKGLLCVLVNTMYALCNDLCVKLSRSLIASII